MSEGAYEVGQDSHESRLAALEARIDQLLTYSQHIQQDVQALRGALSVVPTLDERTRRDREDFLALATRVQNCETKMDSLSSRVTSGFAYVAGGIFIIIAIWAVLGTFVQDTMSETIAMTREHSDQK